MRQKMSGSSRQEVLKLCIDDHNESSWLEKGDQLDQLARLTGYHRKYLIKLVTVGDVPVVRDERRGGRLPKPVQR